MKDESIEIDGFKIIVTYHNESSPLLLEAKNKGIPLIGSYSVMKHQPHTNPGEYHLHVYDKQNQIFAINQSGKGHDGYHGVRIPNKIYKALSKKYKGWSFPPDQIIECLNYTYILNSIIEMNYREILNEIQAVQIEMNLYDHVEKSLILETFELEKAKKQNQVLSKRFHDLFLESVKRIS